MKILLLLFPLILAQAVDGGVPDAANTGIENAPTKESDIAPRAFVHPSGRRIRVVGTQTKSETVSETGLGKVVEVFSLSDESICPVVFSAAPDETKKKPVVPGIDKWTKMRPIVVDRAEEKWIWWTILDRENCLVMAEYPDYIGSTLDEFIALPMPLRRRVLKTYGTCTYDIEGQQVEQRCVVPIGDKKAIQGADVFFPHNLAGRKDINFKRYHNGKITPRNPQAYEAISKEK